MLIKVDIFIFLRTSIIDILIIRKDLTGSLVIGINIHNIWCRFGTVLSRRFGKNAAKKSSLLTKKKVEILSRTQLTAGLRNTSHWACGCVKGKNYLRVFKIITKKLYLSVIVH